MPPVLMMHRSFGFVKTRCWSNAIRKVASDIHFEPYEEDTGYRFRVDGRAGHHQVRPPKRMAPPRLFCPRSRSMVQLNIAERRVPPGWPHQAEPFKGPGLSTFGCIDLPDPIGERKS